METQKEVTIKLNNKPTKNKNQLKILRRQLRNQQQIIDSNQLVTPKRQNLRKIKTQSQFHQNYGNTWLAKTLDPAGTPLDNNMTIPDGQNDPLAIIEYVVTKTIAKPPDTTSQTWILNLWHTPHPTHFCCHYGTNDQFGQSEIGEILNTQLGTYDNDYQLTAAFSALCERYRVSYSSITTKLNCTDLTNEGVVYVCQYPYPSTLLNVVNSTMVPSGSGAVARHCMSWDNDDDITYETMVQSRTAYKNDAKLGTYSVFKHGEESRKWCFTNNTYGVVNYIADTLGKSDVFSGITTIDTTTQPMYVQSPVVSGTNLGHAYLPMPCSNVIKTVYKGIDAAATVEVKIVLGIEIVARPGQTPYPFMNMPSPYNDVALMTHDTAWRYFEDAYPGNYNDLHKFKTVLAKILDVSSKIIGTGISTLYPSLSPLVSLGQTGVNSLVKKLNK